VLLAGQHCFCHALNKKIVCVRHSCDGITCIALPLEQAPCHGPRSSWTGCPAAASVRVRTTSRTSQRTSDMVHMRFRVSLCPQENPGGSADGSGTPRIRPGQTVLRAGIGTVYRAVGQLFSLDGSHPPNGNPSAPSKVEEDGIGRLAGRGRQCLSDGNGTEPWGQRWRQPEWPRPPVVHRIGACQLGAGMRFAVRTSHANRLHTSHRA
jgi:hypothetical protein